MKKIVSLLLVGLMVLSLVACGEESKESSSKRTVKCSYCEAKCDKNDAFCSNCGKPIEIKEEQESNSGEGTQDSVSGSLDKNTDDSFGTSSQKPSDDNKNPVVTPDPAEKIWLRVTKNDSSSKITYFYDYDGNLIAERTTSLADGSFVSLTEYVLDANDNVAELRTTLFTKSYLGDFNWYNKMVYANRYDQKGRILSASKTNERTSNSAGKIDYFYDKSGNLSEVTSYDSLGDISEVTLYKNGKIQTVENRASGFLNTYHYNENGQLIKITQSKGSAEGQLLATFESDSNGNVTKETDYSKTYPVSVTYTYMTLAEYRAQGMDQQPIPESAEFPNRIGKAGCRHCSAHGYDLCQGHMCPICDGAGEQRCAGCKGTGKHAYSHLPNNACVVCYGLGTQICPNCDGMKKEFFDENSGW